MVTSIYGNGVNHEPRHLPLAQVQDLPVSVLQYVARTQEDLVLNNPGNEDIFTQDAYIVSAKPRSILCVPILSKAHVTGLLYLENRQSTHAFSQDRVDILKLLASQSAIAIENAKLCQQLDESRNRYVSLYQNAVEGIWEANLDGEVTNINPAAAKLLGNNSPEEFLLQPQIGVTHTFVDPAALATFSEMIRTTARVLDFETLIRRKDNTELWVSFSAQLIRSAQGNPTHVEAP